MGSRKQEKLITDENVLKRIDNLVEQMTLEEKIGMVHGCDLSFTKGVERLGIPPLAMTDGPVGVGTTCALSPDVAFPIVNVSHNDDFSTSFPCLTAIAATWNEKMAYKNGKALGNEVRGRGRDVSLSPAINIHRTPLCGRNFEYFSEDPYLVSRMTVNFIKGLQKNDISCCVKHFVANNQEENRASVNVEMDDRTLHEIYLPGFKAAVIEGNAYSIMAAYNKLRGHHCCQSKYLLTELAREEWGFDGIFITDWGGLHDTKEGIEAGMDIEMACSPYFDNYYFAKPLQKMIESGEIKEELLDNMIKRILKVMFKLKMFDPDNRKKGAYNAPENRKDSYKVARESIVLLKNDKNILPLSEKQVKKLAVIGENAEYLHAGSGGSSGVRALYEINPLMGLKMFLGGNVKVEYAQGYSSNEGDPKKLQKLAEEAYELAAKHDIVIYVGGLNHPFESESYDRKDMKLPYGQDELIKKLLEINPDTIIVNMSGAPVEMREWIDSASTVVQYWYSGSEGGTALAEVLFGKVNPSGKLPTTFPKSLEDTPVSRFGEYPGDETVHYNEGIFVGYRYYDTYDVEPEFCFGHGLSYTTFEYDDLKVEAKRTEQRDGITVDVSLKVTNTGCMAGAEVVQLYVSDPECSVPRPSKELKGFRKVYLKPGETKKVKLTLSTEDFCYYSNEKSDWVYEDGDFDLLIGSSLRDIRLKARI